MSELMRSMMRRGGQGDGCRWVCHKCDRPPCCNPDHLFVGTQLDDVAVCWLKVVTNGGSND